jgi:hypothetical protein
VKIHRGANGSGEEGRPNGVAVVGQGTEHSAAPEMELGSAVDLYHVSLGRKE